MCFSFTKMKFIGFTLAPRNAPTQIRFLVNELAWRIQRRIYLAPLFAKLMLIISLTSIGYVPGVYGRSMLSMMKGIIVSFPITSIIQSCHAHANWFGDDDVIHPSRTFDWVTMFSPIVGTKKRISMHTNQVTQDCSISKLHFAE